MKRYATLIALLAGTHAACASQVLKETFDTAPANAPLQTSSVWNRVTNDKDHVIVQVLPGYAGPFNATKPEDRFLSLKINGTDPAASLNAVAWAGSMAKTGKVEFDFSIPSDTGYKGVVTFRIGAGNSNGDTHFAVAFGTGSRGGKIYATQDLHLGSAKSLAEFEFGNPYHLTVYYNASSEPASYDRGTTRAGTMDIWLGDKIVGDDIPTSGGNPDKDPACVNFVAYSSTNLCLYIDNLSAYSAR